MLSVTLLLAALAFVSPALGHPENSSPFANHPAELARRQLEMNKRHVMARACAPQVAAYQKQRKARRALRRRGIDADGIHIKGKDFGHDHPGHPGHPGHSSTHHSGHPQAPTTATDPSGSSTSLVAGSGSVTSILPTSEVVSSTTSALGPHYSTIQNTCITAPEVTEGIDYPELSPYYLRDDYVREDLRENQTGTTLYLDIGVIDITTCTPAQDIFVEIWACSAQGVYSAFGTGPTMGGNPTALPTGSSGTIVPPSQTMSGPFPSGSGFPPGGFPGGGTSKANGDNFLRGGLPADTNGMVELMTIYPGFYTGRTVHIHTMIHQNISYHSNGTIISASGNLRHIGQVFFDEALNDEVLAQAAYQGTGQSRTYNAQDGILEQANSGGYSAFAEVERLGDSLDEGLLGYITIGIDSNASYNVTTNNYWDPNFTASSAIAG